MVIELHINMNFIGPAEVGVRSDLRSNDSSLCMHLAVRCLLVSLPRGSVYVPSGTGAYLIACCRFDILQIYSLDIYIDLKGLNSEDFCGNILQQTILISAIGLSCRAL